MSRQRRRRGPPRCKDCQKRVVWFMWAHAPGSWRTFEPMPVDARGQHATAYPVEGRIVWRLRDLVEDLIVRRQCSTGEAENEARDMPWHVPHTCPTTEGDSTP